MSGRVEVAPIMEADVPRAARFLQAQLNDRVSAETWSRAMDSPWAASAPNHGFMLLRDGELLGVLLAFYARRAVGGTEVSICNLGAWCVVPEARVHSLRLLRTALAQEGYLFTDLSPSGPVVPLNRRLGFRELSTTTRLLTVVSNPALLFGGRARCITDARQIEARLSEPDLKIYQDHAGALAARHAVLSDAQGECYVVYRRDRRRDLNIFATVLHVSDVETFRRLAGRLAARLLREGVLFVVVEDRVGGHPVGARQVSMNRPKMVKTPGSELDDVDYLYSELVCVPW